MDKSKLSDPDSELEKILLQAHQSFQLDFFGKKVWTPYRINTPFQPDRRRYGKAAPAQIIHDTIEIAEELGFGLRSASSDEIRSFMKEQLLGIDCSGYAYQLLDKILMSKKSSMEQIGFPKASSTNVKTLTSEPLTHKITGPVKHIRAGDMIRFGPDQEGNWHVLVVLNSDDAKIIYAHSSKYNVPDGVGIGEIIITDSDKPLNQQSWQETLNTGDNRGELLDTDRGDGVYRLNAIK